MQLPRLWRMCNVHLLTATSTCVAIATAAAASTTSGFSTGISASGFTAGISASGRSIALAARVHLRDLVPQSPSVRQR